jgi:hypothetical protein
MCPLMTFRQLILILGTDETYISSEVRRYINFRMMNLTNWEGMDSNVYEVLAQHMS